MKITVSHNKIYIPPAIRFSLADTLDCGQSFTFELRENRFCGVLAHTPVMLRQDEDGILVTGMDENMIRTVLIPYLDLERDYEPILQKLNRNPVLRRAIQKCGGIRLLQQDFFEVLISFIVSQNNNIPRIKGILKRMLEIFGEDLGDGFFDFPTPQRLASCTLEDLAPLRCGFRGKYILDAAKKVAEGKLDPIALAAMDMDDARKILMTVNGIGPKVADCILLFGIGHRRAFPKDVWIKKVLAAAFPKGIPAYFAPYEGYAQQYLFQYVRCGDDPFAAKLRKTPKK